MNTDGKPLAIIRTLHKKNAFVLASGYLSATKPILQETIQDGLREDEGPKHIRTSRDNGETWTVTGKDDWREQDGERTSMRDAGILHVDPNHNLVLQFFSQAEYGPAGDYSYFGAGADGTPLQARTGRIFYRISRDQGKTWEPDRQLIQTGPAYDAIHWADGIYYEKNMCRTGELLRVTQLSDGTLILPVNFLYLDANGELVKHVDRFGEVIWPAEASAVFRGTWRDDRSDLDWEMSSHVIAPQHLSSYLCEPAVVEMDDDKLMMVMRGNSSATQTMTGVKFFCISRDAGRTWNPPVPLTYPDNRRVHSPACMPAFFRSKKNGRVYLITNILSKPCRGCDPRYPLKIVEVHPEHCWAIPQTETTIVDRQDHHPEFVRYSNLQWIEDQVTGNPVIYMTEDIIDRFIRDSFKPGTIEPDASRYEIVLPD